MPDQNPSTDVLAHLDFETVFPCISQGCDRPAEFIALGHRDGTKHPTGYRCGPCIQPHIDRGRDVIAMGIGIQCALCGEKFTTFEAYLTVERLP